MIWYLAYFLVGVLVTLYLSLARKMDGDSAIFWGLIWPFALVWIVAGGIFNQGE